MKIQMDEQVEKCMAGFRSIVDGLFENFRAEFMDRLQAVQSDITARKQQMMAIERQNAILRK